jgi:anti-sigma factor RsiW
MAIVSEPCLSYGEDLSALLDGELDSAREAELRAHLAACEACRTHLASLASVNDGLRALAGRPVPGNLEAQLFARIARERGNGAAALSRRRSLRGRRLGATFAVAALAAAAALALYLGVVRNPTPVEPGPAIAQQPAPPLPEPTPVAPRVQEPAASQLAESAPAPQDGMDTEPDLEAASDEDLAVATELETLDELDDLDVIANLEVLERMEVGGNDAG